MEATAKNQHRFIINIKNELQKGGINISVQKSVNVQVVDLMKLINNSRLKNKAKIIHRLNIRDSHGERHLNAIKPVSQSSAITSTCPTCRKPQKRLCRNRFLVCT